MKGLYILIFIFNILKPIEIFAEDSYQKIVKLAKSAKVPVNELTDNYRKELKAGNGIINIRRNPASTQNGHTQGCPEGSPIIYIHAIKRKNLHKICLGNKEIVSSFLVGLQYLKDNSNRIDKLKEGVNKGYKASVPHLKIGPKGRPVVSIGEKNIYLNKNTSERDIQEIDNLTLLMTKDNEVIFLHKNGAEEKYELDNGYINYFGRKVSMDAYLEAKEELDQLKNLEVMQKRDRPNRPLYNGPTENGLIELLISKQPYKSLDDLLDNLPEKGCTKSLVHTSQSAEKDDVSYAHPRVIVNCSGATIAFTTNEKGQFYNSAQIIEYNDKTEKFDFYTIDDYQDSKVIIKKVEDENKCNRCHNGNYIWSSYNHWPGFYGSDDDVVVSGAKSQIVKKEFDELRKILLGDDTPKRLKKLTKNIRVYKEVTWERITGFQETQARGGGINRAVGINIANTNTEKIINELKTLEKLLAPLVYKLFMCSKDVNIIELTTKGRTKTNMPNENDINDFISEIKSKPNLKKIFPKGNLEILNKKWEILKKIINHNPYQSGKSLNPGAFFSLLIEAMGLPNERFDLSFQLVQDINLMPNNKFNYGLPAKYHYHASFHNQRNTIDESTQGKVLKKMVEEQQEQYLKKNTTLSKYLHTPFLNRDFHIYDGDKSEAEVKRILCWENEKELKQVTAPTPPLLLKTNDSINMEQIECRPLPIPDDLELDAMKLISDVSQLDNELKSCHSCHGASDKITIPESLKKLHKLIQTDSILKQKIISSIKGGRMPPKSIKKYSTQEKKLYIYLINNSKKFKDY